MTEVVLPTVLIVDDDRHNRAILAELLHRECRLLLAKDGEAALRIIAQEDVSLVLLDVSMPGIDGYEVLRQTKANPRTADTGIIFITGFSDEQDEERGLLMGAADYVHKPIKPAIVHARIMAHLKLAAQRRELERLSLQDGLTGIANRRYFDEAYQNTLLQCARERRSLGVAIIDVDHFKQYNDFYGHLAGDEALRAVAGAIKQFARRPSDIAARYGGEEFALLIPDASDFAVMLEALRAKISALDITHERSATAKVLTVSGGGVVGKPTPQIKVNAILDRADELLYLAKANGRNTTLVENLGQACSDF